MAAAFTMFATKVAKKERRVPTGIVEDPLYSGENMAEPARRITDAKSGKSVLREHDLAEPRK